MASTFKHRKKRNVGLTYEFLVRKLTDQMVSEDSSGRKTLRILQKHFGSGAPLAKERQLFDIVMSTRGVSEQVARRILSEVRVAAKKSSVKELDFKKSDLLKDVHHVYGQKFFDEYRLPEYRLVASIQLFLDSCRSSGNITENVGRIQLEEGLVSYMTTTGSYAKQWTQDREVDNLVCKLATKKFEERYGSSFNARQKSLLEAYSKCSLTGDHDKVATRLYEDRSRISEILLKHRDAAEISSDKVLMERYEEASRKLEWLDVTKANDDAVEEILLYWKLVEEVTSNG